MAKRYSMHYESDVVNRMSNTSLGEHDHFYGFASTVRTAKSYIRKCRKEIPEQNPRNFRIYDSEGEVDPETDYVPCVYQED